MNIIKNYLTSRAFEWSDAEKENKNSVAGFILRHIEATDKLRDAQIEALKVYLWLKCVCDNKPLVEVFKERYPDTEGDSLTTLLVHIAQELENKKLERFAQSASSQELEGFFVDLFGGYNHISNILLSLPMGAGKTFVMASMIYIDLYFNLNNVDNRFAKNFLIFAPSGLKSSVIPSLRSIERFDPTWILPTDIATQIKKQIKFVVLDVPTTAKKATKSITRTPARCRSASTKQTPADMSLLPTLRKSFSIKSWRTNIKAHCLKNLGMTNQLWKMNYDTNLLKSLALPS